MTERIQTLSRECWSVCHLKVSAAALHCGSCVFVRLRAINNQRSEISQASLPTCAGVFIQYWHSPGLSTYCHNDADMALESN